MSKFAIGLTSFVLSVGTVMAAFMMSLFAYASAMRSPITALIYVPVALLMWYLSWRSWKGLHPYMFGGTK